MTLKNQHINIWDRYHQSAGERGMLICQLLQQFIPLAGKNILDVGCGWGGASIALAQAGAKVTAIDQDDHRLRYLQEYARQTNLPITIIHGDIEKSFFTKQFHAIVLWDVLEHLGSPALVLNRLYEALQTEGIVCIATPNRLSPINLMADPHYGLPMVALLRREKIRTIVAKIFGWHDEAKGDFPQLLSLRQIALLLHRMGFSWRFCHVEVIGFALKHPEALWCHPLHLKIIHRLKNVINHSIIERYLPNKLIPFNRFIMPTFYIIGHKR